MITGIIILVGLIIAAFTFIKGEKTIIKKDRWGDDREVTNTPLITKVVGIILITIIAGAIQPFAIEKVDSGYKGIKVV
jgi:uncharacterized membrane protein YidH (DUF202 family)